MNKYILILVGIVSFSCSEEITITDFNSTAFKTAKKACDSSRIQQLESIKQEQSKLIGLSEGNIKSLFGRPNEQEILPRMGRRYYYYLTPDKKCNEKITTRPPSIMIEFEHMGRVKLAIIPNKESITN